MPLAPAPIDGRMDQLLGEELPEVLQAEEIAEREAALDRDHRKPPAEVGHVPQPSNPDFRVCENPTSLDIHIWIRWLLEPEIPISQQIDLHVADIYSKWFGALENSTGVPSLLVWPRLSQLVMKHPSTANSELCERQYPSLVSFFGDTGGGKSTLIKTLIRNCNSSEHWETPVPGNREKSHYSTSGDVNLYAAPSSTSSDAPMFYADCEGLRGGSVPVVKALAGAKFYEPPSLGRSLRIQETPEERMRRTLREHREKSTHDLRLLWAVKRGGALQEDPSSRQYIVKHLFPRFLYIFSDVVCYVTENARSTEQEVSDLIDWASLGYRKTVNQRIKPSLIIIINKDPRPDASQWCDIRYATKEQIDKLNKSFYRFSALRDKWKARGKTIRSTEDLILCYYDSFKVICIPSLMAVPTGVIASQYEKLDYEIQLASRTIRGKRGELGVMMDVESFNFHTQQAFELFSKSLGNAFDFHYVADRMPVVPVDFADYLVNLLAKLRDQQDTPMETMVGQEAAMLSNFIPYLASCLALEYAEKREGNLEEFLNAYSPICQKALDRFYKRHWRCEAFNQAREHRCLNFHDGHNKGHQYNPDQTLEIGPFVGRFEVTSVLESLKEEVRDILLSGDLKSRLMRTGWSSGVSKIKSNRSCLTCLSRRPLHLLPCKHCLCDECALRFNTNEERLEEHILKIPHCPLGCGSGPDLWKIRLKPACAGVRVLSLDGGGVRGILELCVLKRVEEAVGIPIQELFDVAIGTSTGGIIALGLFKRQWSVDTAIIEFGRLVCEAFAPRYGVDTPILKHATQLLYSHRYKSSGIEGALKEAFGEGVPLFGHTNTSPERVKVGVISLNNDQGRPFLLANYTRNWLPSANYAGPGVGGMNLSAKGIKLWPGCYWRYLANTLLDDLLRREDNPEDEMMTWEAARCTSASQTYFQPFHHQRAHQHYSDGALCFNNPISIADCERRFIWPKNAQNYPDIVLSIGTGILAEFDSASSPLKDESTVNKIMQKLIPQGLMGKVGVALQTVRSTLDCERKWREFVNTIGYDTALTARYHRLNVALTGKPPKIDDFSKIESLKAEAKIYLSTPSVSTHISLIARQLKASLFYFSPQALSKPHEHETTHICHGHLRCRLSPTMSSQFLALIRQKPIFRVVQDGAVSPVIHPTPTVNFDMKTFVSEAKIELAKSRAKVTIEISFQEGGDAEWCAISGFPCVLEVSALRREMTRNSC